MDTLFCFQEQVSVPPVAALKREVREDNSQADDVSSTVFETKTYLVTLAPVSKQEAALWPGFVPVQRIDVDEETWEEIPVGPVNFVFAERLRDTTQRRLSPEESAELLAAAEKLHFDAA